MPRRARIMLPGIAVHVMQRGNDRADCFFDDEDRGFYLNHLARLLPRARCQLHAYCLMTNHVHLLVTPDEDQGCARLMKGIGQLYAQYVNKRYLKRGHLWEGRFKSCLVQSEHYVLSCYRYIELNPVRARLVVRADEYAWSSHAANAKGQIQPFLTPNIEYERLGRTPGERQAVYRDLFGQMADPELEEIRTATNGGYALGNAAFKRAT
ncbi:MAG TPA: transposase, partial [Burkholderiales bacterium]|nr:transposase [Burkholderiales bacterium]